MKLLVVYKKWENDCPKLLVVQGMRQMKTDWTSVDVVRLCQKLKFITIYFDSQLSELTKVAIFSLTKSVRTHMYVQMKKSFARSRSYKFVKAC